MPLHIPVTLHQPHLGRAISRSRWSTITNSQPLKREMMDIQSAQLNWMPPRQRWYPRQMPQHSMTPWMPWKVGTMMVSLISLRQTAAISESRSGHCFNCQKEGHYWRQCKETLSLELQELSDQQDRE